MPVKRDSFVYHLNWEEVMDNLPGEVREEVRGAIIGYARTGVTPELKPLAKVAFEFVKRDMDWDFQKYQSMVTARSESGKKGAAARDAKQANANDAKQTQQEEANQADYDNDYDYVTHSVCVNSAKARASTPPAPHTDFNFFFPTFWKRNVICAEAETRKFLDFYEAGGWVLEKGAALDSDAKRLAKARQWKPEKPGKRFPDRFAEAWWELAQKAPADVRAQMLSDKVAVDLSGSVPALKIGEETHAWLMGAGRADAEAALLKKWLQCSQTLQFRKY